MTKQSESVFISYAHKDSLEFTRRLAFSLSLYMNVFWDRHVEAGPFPEQLYREIEECNHFILIMTPESLQSDWCKKELIHAETHKKKISLVRLFPADQTIGEDLIEKYTYGDFSEDFDKGFRRLTNLILGSPYSSWEKFGELQDDEQLLKYLKLGYIPGVISKQLSTKVLIDILWRDLLESTSYSNEKNIKTMRYPRTAIGIIRASTNLRQMFVHENDVLGLKITTDMQKLVENFNENR